MNIFYLITVNYQKICVIILSCNFHGRFNCDIDLETSMTLAPFWRVFAQDGGPVKGRGTGDLTGGGGAHGRRAGAEIGVCSEWLKPLARCVLTSVHLGFKTRPWVLLYFPALILWRWYGSLPITTQASIGVGRFIVYHQHNTSWLLVWLNDSLVVAPQ